MKNTWLLLLCLSMLALSGCRQERKTPQAETIEQNNDMMGTLNEIQEGFREINEAENRVTLAKDGEGASRAQQIRENIQFISSTMKRNRELIAKLRQQLRQSSLKGDQLRQTIENLVKQLDDKDQQLQQLRAELDAKDIHISELDETIDNLNSSVADLNKENTRKTETIAS